MATFCGLHWLTFAGKLGRMTAACGRDKREIVGPEATVFSALDVTQVPLPLVLSVVEEPKRETD